jgi:hypothetical protein
MRVIILTLLVTFILFSCDNQPKKSNAADNISVQQPIIKATDTISEEEQNRAIGDIQFGTSKKVASSHIMYFQNDSKGRLGSFKFESVFDDYRHDSLYKVTLQGRAYQVGEYNSGLHDEVALLFQTINAKYGNPTVDNGFPTIGTVPAHYSHRCFSWKIGRKTIEIGIANMVIYYHAILVIYDNKVAQEIEAEQANEQATEEKKAKKLL